MSETWISRGWESETYNVFNERDAYDWVQVNFNVLLDPLKFLVINIKHWHPLDNPSEYYILVLLAPFVVWGYMCKPCINRSTNLKWFPVKHFYFKTASAGALDIAFRTSFRGNKKTWKSSAACLNGFAVVFLYMSPASFSFPAILRLQEDSNNQKPMLYCSTKMHSNLCN